MKRPTTAGFTILEVMVTAVIVLLLAGMLVPNLGRTVEEAQETAVVQDLERLRRAVDFYAFQHNDVLPGVDTFGVWLPATFVAQLVTSSDRDGNTAAPGTAGFPYGPYLETGIPANPYNRLDTVTVVAPGVAFMAPDNTTGWVFIADTGELRANTPGNTVSGQVIFGL
jgi:general secretion pathway protein G